MYAGRGVLFWKKRAEEALQRSGLDYTIVRPGACLHPPQPRCPTKICTPQAVSLAISASDGRAV